MSKQGHYIFNNKDDAEDMAEIFKGRVIPDYHHSVYPMYHVWFEYEDKDNIDFTERLMHAHIDLRKKLNESKEHIRVLTQKNNELIDKLNREYDKNRDVNRALEIQLANNITMERKIDMLTKMIKDP